MLKYLAVVAVLMMSACASDTKQYFHAAGFDIPKGQPVTAFFDDFEEPVHAHYIGNNTLRWTYLVDDKGEIVRHCTLRNGGFNAKNFCQLNVEFYQKRVSDVYSDCL